MEHLASLSAIRAFCRVLELSSFRRAADCLNVPIATVSGRIKSLEAGLGVVLLVRGARGVTATAAGEAYYERVLPLLRGLDEAGQLLKDPHLQPRGRVNVSVPASVAREILAPSLPEFMARYPEVSLRVLATDRIADLSACGLDCAVRACEPADDGRTVRALVRMPQFFAASPALLARHGKPETLEEIGGLPFINYDCKRDDVRMRVHARSGAEIRQFEVDAPMSVDDGAAYVSLACAGLGVVQSPLWDLRPHLATGQLRLLIPPWRGPDLAFHMVYAEGKQYLPRVRVFVEWMHELLAHARHHDPELAV